MALPQLTIEQLWEQVGFRPNDSQRRAILHADGPLFLTAGPGSGKTRVLLWRTLNLIVFHGVDPGKIFLSTFTQKAALQLKDGLRSLLGIASNYTNQPYDIAKMSLGTVHSICQKMLGDRIFSPNRERQHPPVLLDELGQYFKIQNRENWTHLCEAAGFEIPEKKEDSEEEEMTLAEAASMEINGYFEKTYQGAPKKSRHEAVVCVMELFNRFSEESLDPQKCKTNDKTLQKLLVMYQAYLDMLGRDPMQKQVDFSLLQKATFEQIEAFPGASSVYEHIIIDEYQDTNTIQEKIFFALAKGHQNICVVGDDDQALYRFRGATVENLVEFETRCKNAIGRIPVRIDLDINYRSRKKIVDAYTSFIHGTNWKKEDGSGYYRIHDKNIQSHSSDDGISVVTTTPCPKKETVASEVVKYVYQLKKSGIITDYNQCAFLFPSIKNNTRVNNFIDAFKEFNQANGLAGTDKEMKIYAPRAGSFLETDEAKAVWGLFMFIFDYSSKLLQQKFNAWVDDCKDAALELTKTDGNLKQFVIDKKKMLSVLCQDYEMLLEKIEENGLSLEAPFPSEKIKIFANLPGVSQKTRQNLVSKYFHKIMLKREKDGVPFTASYILNRATSVDWTVLDLFYQLNGFDYFRAMYDKATRKKNASTETSGERASAHEAPIDEGPICNLALITDYLSRFMEYRTSLINAAYIKDDKFNHSFFNSFTYAIFRLDESEYENADDPFPKGRIPFLTIHQSKGLEFPVVVLGSPDKRKFPADKKEKIIRELLPEKKGEPLEKISTFDTMRMFYVALSRAQNLLIISRFGKGNKTPPTSYWETSEFASFFKANRIPTIPMLNLDAVPSVNEKKSDLAKSYAYVSDYIFYKKCPRQYMVMRKYDFVPSRSQEMLFGTIVHKTIEDLHNLLLIERQRENKESLFPRGEK